MATKATIDETRCQKCRSQKMWEDCYSCDEDGMVDHDCGDDTCCCLEPWPNVRCDICNGQGGWYRCYVCAPEEH